LLNKGNNITNVLELFVDFLKVSKLLDEFLHVVHRLLDFRNANIEPFLGHFHSLFVDNWYFLLDLLLNLLWCWQKLLLDQLRV
jgi:hypothetical protein